VDDAVGDATLVALARAGEIEAFAGLLERHRTSLYATAVPLLRNREDAMDAVQETYLTALGRLGTLRDPAAAAGWLHAILRNVCLMQLRRSRRETAWEAVELPTDEPGPADMVDRQALRDWVWSALDSLTPDDRITVMLRYFSRCTSYQDIAAVTAVPIGTVRSRLHRARSQLASALRLTVDGTNLSQASTEAARRTQWEHFYAEVHQTPIARTYRDVYASRVHVRDTGNSWLGVTAWSEHEREAIELGVRARIAGLAASRDTTILEIDFLNPAGADDHCPPRSTFVHRLEAGRSHRLDIHYV